MRAENAYQIICINIRTEGNNRILKWSYKDRNMHSIELANNTFQLKMISNYLTLMVLPYL